MAEALGTEARSYVLKNIFPTEDTGRAFGKFPAKGHLARSNNPSMYRHRNRHEKLLGLLILQNSANSQRYALHAKSTKYN